VTTAHVTFDVVEKKTNVDDRLHLVLASEMTYIVSGGALNSTHSLTRWIGQTEIL